MTSALQQAIFIFKLPIFVILCNLDIIGIRAKDLLF